jgi:hypothetical protein
MVNRHGILKVLRGVLYSKRRGAFEPKSTPVPYTMEATLIYYNRGKNETHDCIYNRMYCSSLYHLYISFI